MALRNFSSVAVATTLSSGITNVSTSITVAALSGYPAAPFIARLDGDTVNEEVVLVTNVAGTTLTVTRGYDSTVAVSHSSGAAFSHSASAIDFREANSHVNASTAVHGIAGAVVGTTDTQTLSNKTISGASNTLSSIPQSAVTSLTTDLATATAHYAATAVHGATGAVVGTTNTQTLTNKTLTAPVISTIVNTGTLTLPTSTDTLVGRATTDTLTNKTLTSPTVNTPVLTLATTTSVTSGRTAWDSTNKRIKVGDGSAVKEFTADDAAATLLNKTLTSPVIDTPTVSAPVINGAITGTGFDTAAWTPTLGNVTSGTIDANFVQVGKMCYISIDITGGTATAANTVTFSMPSGLTAARTQGLIAMNAGALRSARVTSGTITLCADTTGANFGAGASLVNTRINGWVALA